MSGFGSSPTSGPSGIFSLLGYYYEPSGSHMVHIFSLRGKPIIRFYNNIFYIFLYYSQQPPLEFGDTGPVQAGMGGHLLHLQHCVCSELFNLFRVQSLSREGTIPSLQTHVMSFSIIYLFNKARHISLSEGPP